MIVLFYVQVQRSDNLKKEVEHGGKACVAYKTCQ